ncbi:hypothetical protein EZS27_013777, partial [termite gut metagenome]
KKMWEETTKYGEGWNFGPRVESVATVWEVATKVLENYGKGELRDVSDPNTLHEANLLMLDVSKAKVRLGWETKMGIRESIEMAVEWYKKYIKGNIYSVCVKQINFYVQIRK